MKTIWKHIYRGDAIKAYYTDTAIILRNGRGYGKWPSTWVVYHMPDLVPTDVRSHNAGKSIYAGSLKGAKEYVAVQMIDGQSATRAGYIHNESGWKIELSGPVGKWHIITTKGVLAKRGRKESFKLLRSAIDRATYVMAKRASVK